MNKLYYGDNLPILREYIDNGSVDLIYLDPPFNSNRSYNVLFKDESGKEADAQITAFEDTWHWGHDAEESYRDIIQNAAPVVSNMISALRQFVGTNQMMAYLTMMTARLIELHRVLKPTGSIYLHCDPTASHYLKVVMDAIFGIDNYRDEIIWKRTTAHNDTTSWGNVHDTILWYSKSSDFVWNPVYLEHDEEYKKRFRNKDADGRLWTDGNLTAKGLSGGGYTYEYKGATSLWRVPLETMKRLDAEGRLHFTRTGGIRLKNYLDEMPGRPLQDVITDIYPINSQAQERLGYPTQKPLALLERIIQASSNEGDVVLDPFCGCGTAVVAAEKLKRPWIGIDVTHLSISLMKYRMKDAFGLVEQKDYVVVGEPETISGARQLASDDRYQFQWWALSLIQAKPLGGQGGSREGKKGSDKGIDGVINFINEKNNLERVLVQVKSGHVRSGDVRDLRGVVEREQAAIGIFITLEDPSRDMISEAVSAGFYRSNLWQQDFPRIQILTIEELLKGKMVVMPKSMPGQTFKQAEKIKKNDASQAELFSD